MINEKSINESKTSTVPQCTSVQNSSRQKSKKAKINNILVAVYVDLRESMKFQHRRTVGYF